MAQALVSQEALQFPLPAGASPSEQPLLQRCLVSHLQQQWGEMVGDGVVGNTGNNDNVDVVLAITPPPSLQGQDTAVKGEDKLERQR